MLGCLFQAVISLKFKRDVTDKDEVQSTKLSARIQMSEAKHTNHVTETPDVSYIKNLDVTHEVSDVHVTGIVKFLVGLSLLTIGTFLLVWALFGVFEKAATEPKPSPMTLTEKDRLPPEPRLQSAPGFAEDLEKTAAIKNEQQPAQKEESGNAITAGGAQPKGALYEIDILRRHWHEVLKNGPVDQSGKTFGLPIEKAKEEVLQQGLPVRGQTAGSSRQ